MGQGGGQGWVDGGGHQRAVWRATKRSLVPPFAINWSDLAGDERGRRGGGVGQGGGQGRVDGRGGRQRAVWRFLVSGPLKT